MEKAPDFNMFRMKTGTMFQAFFRKHFTHSEKQSS